MSALFASFFNILHFLLGWLPPFPAKVIIVVMGIILICGVLRLIVLLWELIPLL